MITLSLAQAFEILKNTPAVLIDGAVTRPSLDELNGDEDNQFLSLDWDDGEQAYGVTFREGLNREVRAEGASLFLVDEDGEDAEIVVLVRANLEAAK